MGDGDQGGVVVPACPGAAFVVVEAELAFQLFVVEFDLPAHPGEPGELFGLGVWGEVRDPVVGRLGLPEWPLSDQPLFASRRWRPVPPLVGSPDPREHEPGADRYAVGPVAEGDRARLTRGNTSDPVADRLGFTVGQDTTLGPPGRCRGLGHGEHGLGANTFVWPPTASTYSLPASLSRSRNAVLSP